MSFWQILHFVSEKCIPTNTEYECHPARSGVKSENTLIELLYFDLLFFNHDMVSEPKSLLIMEEKNTLHNLNHTLVTRLLNVFLKKG